MHSSSVSPKTNTPPTLDRITPILISRCNVCHHWCRSLCFICKKESYCSDKCQRADWLSHKNSCSPTAPNRSRVYDCFLYIPTERTMPRKYGKQSCVVCHQLTRTFCARCDRVAYCSAICQRQDWPTHKARCVTGHEIGGPGYRFHKSWRKLCSRYLGLLTHIATTHSYDPSMKWILIIDFNPMDDLYNITISYTPIRTMIQRVPVAVLYRVRSYMAMNPERLLIISIFHPIPPSVTNTHIVRHAPPVCTRGKKKITKPILICDRDITTTTQDY